jgi:hypothetical protein
MPCSLPSVRGLSPQQMTHLDLAQTSSKKVRLRKRSFGFSSLVVVEKEVEGDINQAIDLFLAREEKAAYQSPNFHFATNRSMKLFHLCLTQGIRQRCRP